MFSPQTKSRAQNPRRCRQKALRRQILEKLEPRQLLAAAPFGTNVLQPVDVTRDGDVTPNDILVVINALADEPGRGNGSISPSRPGDFTDVNGDGVRTPGDILQVINALADRSPILAATLPSDSSPDVLGNAAGDQIVGESLDLITNDYRIDLNVSVVDRGDLNVEMRIDGDGSSENGFVDITDHFAGNRASLTPSDIDTIAGAPLSDGEHRVELRMGQRPPIDFTLTVDRVAPETEQIDLEREFDSGNLRDGKTIADSVTIVGNVEPDAIVKESSGQVRAADASGRFEYTSVPLAVGANSFVFDVYDAAGNKISQAKTIERVVPNTPPQIDPINPIQLTVGDVFSQTISVQDAEGAAVVLSISSQDILPTGNLTADGLLTFRPGPDDVGTYEFTITATDGQAESTQVVSLSVAADPVTTTRLSGIVQNTNQEPLAGIPVHVGSVQTTTGADGHFTLDFGDIPFPPEKLVIEGAAFVGSVVYPSVAERMDLVVSQGPYDSVRNQIDRPIFLPALDVAGGETVDPNAETVIQQELSGGGMATVTVGQGTLKDQQGNDFTGVLSVTEVPPDLTPAALPRGVSPDTVVTVQPGEMNFDRPSQIALPNRSGLPAGSELELWSINHLTGDFDVVGRGRVSFNGSMIETIEGGIRSSSWHFFTPPPNDEPNDPSDNDRSPDEDCQTCKASVSGTSEIVLHSGEYVESHALPTYQSQGQDRGVSLTYRSMRADPRPIVHFGYGNVQQNRIYATVDVRIDGIDILQNDSSGLEAGRGHFWKADDDAYASLQLDLRAAPTGVYDYTLEYGTGSFAMRNIDNELSPSFNGRNREFRDQVVSINSVDSPFGAGWSIDGWMQLVENDNGSVLVYDAQEELVYDQRSGGGYDAPPGDYAQLEKQGDGSFRRTTLDQTVTLFNSAGAIDSVTDRNGNVTSYEYDTEGQLVKIVDPVGLETVLAYENGKVHSITDPAGRATEFFHDEWGNLVEITAPDGSTRTFDYDAGHRITAETNQNGDRETTTYGFHGRVESVVRRDGQTMTFQPAQVQGLFPPEQTLNAADPPQAISSADAVTRYTDASGDEKNVLLDAAGQEVTMTDDAGTGQTTNRNSQNEINSVANARGDVTQFVRDDRGNVIVIADSETQNGGLISDVIANAGDQNWHRFEIAESTLVHFETLRGEGLDAQLDSFRFNMHIEDDDGKLIEDSLSIANRDQLLRLEPGRYRVVVDADDNETGPYRFRMRDIRSAVPISENETFVVSQGSLGGEESSLYRFDARQGESYFIDVEFFASIRLAAPDGTLIELEDDQQNGSDQIARSLPMDGTYTMVVSGVQGTQDFGLYSIDAPSPTQLQVGQRYQSSFDKPGASRSYTLSIDQYQRFYLDTLTNSATAQVTLDGPHGRLIDTSFSGDDWGQPIGWLPPGDYELTMTANDDVGFVDFRVHDLTDAVQVTPGVPINADLSEGVETDFYQLTLNAGDQFNLELIASDSTRPRWRLFSPMLDELFEESFIDDINGLVAPIGGTYTLLIEGRQNETGAPNYTFAVNPLGNAGANATSGSAIDIGQAIAGNIATSDQVDSYLLSIDDTSYLLLDSLTDAANFRVTISNAFDTIYSSRLYDSPLDDLVLLPGDYLVEIETIGSQTGDYGFRLADLRSDQALVLGENTQLTFPNGRESQLRSFQASAGEELYLEISSVTDFPFSGEWRLFGPSGEENLEAGGDRRFTNPLVSITQTGTHTLVFDANTDDTDAAIGFSLTPIVQQTATGITLGAVTTGQTTVPRQADRFTFTLQSTTTIHFDSLIDVSGPIPRWSLIGPTGNTIGVPLSFGQNNKLTDLGPGQYEIQVVANATDDLGDYSFRLLDTSAATQINSDQPIDSELTNAFQTDAYRIELESGRRYFFDTNETQTTDRSDAYLLWTLIDPLGDTVFSQPMLESATTDELNFHAPVDGQYTLLVRGPTESPSVAVTYGFDVRSYDAPESIPLTLGQNTTASISTPGEIVEYSFSLTDDQLLIFQRPSSTAFQTQLTLKGPSGTPITSSNFFRDMPFAIAGDYTLQISGLHDQTGGETFTIVSTLSATPVDLSNNIVGQTSPGVPELYRFPASAGDRLNVNRISAADSDAAWKVYSPSGDEVRTRTLGTEQLQFTLEETGDYFLAVGNRDFGEVDQNSRPYTLNLTLDETNQTDPDTTGIAALTLGEVTNLNLNSGQQAVYTFTAAQSGGLLIQHHGENNLRYRFYGQAMRVSEQTSGRKFVEIHGQPYSASADIFLAAGDYVLVVEGSGGDTGDFAFSLNQLPLGTPVSLDVPVSGQLATRFDSQTFTFDADEGTTLLLDIAEQEGQAYQDYTVFDPFGTRILQANSANEFQIPRTGQYSVLVADSGVDQVAASDFQFTLVRPATKVGGGVAITPNSFEQFEYDSDFNQLTRHVDALGNETLYRLDPETGDTLAVIEVVGALDADINNGDDVVTQFTYTDDGQIDTITDPLGRVTDNDYDVLGRLILTTVAVGKAIQAETGYEYDAAGNLIRIVDQRGNATSYSFDSLGRLLQVTQPDPDGSGPLLSPETAFEYDARGNLVSIVDPQGNQTQQTFDAMDRLSQVIHPDASETIRTYDGDGNLLTVTDPLGQTTAYEYDSRNRLVTTTDPDGGVTSFEYDSDDNLIALVDPVSNRTEFQYDSRDRLVREIDPLGNETTYQYDLNDNRVSMTDRNNRTTRFFYDELDRLVRETWLDENGNPVNEITTVYDENGNATSMSDNQSNRVFTYDDRDRMATSDNAGTPGAPEVLLTYGYDSASNVISVSDTLAGSANGRVTTYQYDAIDRVIDLSQSTGTVIDKRVSLAYNALGQYATITRYSDVTSQVPTVATSFAYDTRNRLTDLRHSNQTGDIAFYEFSYDTDNRITSVNDIDGLTNYTYDDRDQLTVADRVDTDTRGDESYAYDANGNRLESHRHGDDYVTGAANRLLSDGTFHYTYDAEGNRLTQANIATGEVRRFTWDHRNRLTQIEDRDATDAVIQTVKFSYDTTGRRLSKSVDTAAADEIVTHFIYDREDVILDFVEDNSGTDIDQRYLHGPGIDEVFAQESGTGEVFWLTTDHLGTTRDLVDSSGAVAQHLQYDSFGNALEDDLQLVSTRYLFTGREYDVETELQYSRARYYDSSFGMFLSEDPIHVFAGDTNYARYVGNRPLDTVDPSGQIGNLILDFFLKFFLEDIYDTFLQPERSKDDAENNLLIDLFVDDVIAETPEDLADREFREQQHREAERHRRSPVCFGVRG